MDTYLSTVSFESPYMDKISTLLFVVVPDEDVFFDEEDGAPANVSAQYFAVASNEARSAK